MIDLMEELYFILTKSKFIVFCKILNSFSQKVESFFYQGFTCFTDPLSDWAEGGSLSRKVDVQPD